MIGCKTSIGLGRHLVIDCWNPTNCYPNERCCYKLCSVFFEVCYLKLTNDYISCAWLIITLEVLIMSTIIY